MNLIRTAGRAVMPAEFLWHCCASFVPFMPVDELTPILDAMEAEGLLIRTTLKRVLYDQKRQSYEVSNLAYRLPEPGDGGAP